MSVQVENVVEYEGALTFNIRGVETCVVNSLRRTCLTNIKSLVFKGFPHNESSINIIKNKPDNAMATFRRIDDCNLQILEFVNEKKIEVVER